MKILNAGLKRYISNYLFSPSIILVISTCKKNLSSQFFDLDIENPLGGGTVQYRSVATGRIGSKQEQILNTISKNAGGFCVPSSV
jgi:hypothetical protein